MLFIWIGYIIACIHGIRFSKQFPDYIDKTQTTAIKGIFAGIIMFSHFRQYADLNNSAMDIIFNNSIGKIGQLMVVMFLFYSGYGIAVSSRDNPEYFKTFFRHRVIRTLLYFDIAILFFLLCNLFQGKIYPLKQILLSFVGWESVGNSNWFVFAILYAYAVTLIAAKLNGNKINIKTIILLIFGCGGYILLMMKFKNPYWYNTIMTFPAGILYGYYKDTIDSLLKRNYVLCFLAYVVLFAVSRHFNYDVYIYEVYAAAFALCFTLITYKVKLVNPFLMFMGKYSFDIYLLQRIPAMLLHGHISNNLIYFILFAVCTIICAMMFNKLNKRVLSWL